MLSVQATSLGIYVHQMGGFDKSAARQAFAIPDGYDPVVAIAIGYRDAADSLPEDLRIREVEPRMRKPLSEFVFSGRWGSPIDSEGGPTVN
jgi:nitroreductase